MQSNSTSPSSLDPSLSPPLQRRARRLARNTLLTLGGTVFPTFVGIVTVPRIVAALGTDRFGLLALVWLVLGYAGVFDFGLGRATTKFVAQAEDDPDSSLVPRIIVTTLTVQLPIGLFCGLVLAALTPWLTGRVLHVPAALNSEAQAAFFLVAAAIPLTQATSLLRGVLEALQRFDLVNMVRLPASVASFVLPLVAAYMGMNLRGIVWVLVASRLIVLIVHAWLCLRLIPNLLSEGKSDWALFRPLFHFGSWTAVSTVATQIQSYLERFLIGAFYNIAAVGYYSAPSEMIARLAVIPSALASSLFPEFSAQEKYSRRALVTAMARSIKYLLLCLVPIVAFGFVFANRILLLWLGPEFANAAAPCARVLLLCFLLNAIGYIPFTAIHACGKPNWKAKLDLVELPMFVLLCFWLIPTYGLLGAALAKLAVQIVDSCGLFWMVAVACGVTIRDQMSERCGEALVLSFLFTAGSCALLFGSTGFLANISLFLFGLLVYGLLVARFAVDDRDRLLLTDLGQALRR
jgi:O-antigen/teichoic acid export membrane protein